MVDEFVKVEDGVQLRIRLEGPLDLAAGGQVPLLLSNSLGLDLTSWDVQVPWWSRTRQVIRYDTRGHGASEASTEPLTLDRLGRDAAAVLDHLGVVRADVCGLSLGGLTALWLARYRPELVRGVVLAATAARIGTERVWRDRAAAVRAGGMAAVVPTVLDRFFSQDHRASGHQSTTEAEAQLRAADSVGYAGCCEALAAADLREELEAIGTPCLVICGTADTATLVAQSRSMEAELQHSELVVIDGAGHLVNLEQPTRFRDAVEGFVRRMDALA